MRPTPERIRMSRLPRSRDTALRLARVFDMPARIWLDLQTAHDLSKAAIALKAELKVLKPLKAA